MLNKMYSLPELCFVGGSSENLEFNLYYDKSNPRPFNIYGGEATFSIVHFSNKNSAPVVSKKMDIVLDNSSMSYNVLRVTLDPTDTVHLSGKFIYQITMKDVNDNVEISQGVLTIHSNIDKGLIAQ